MKSKLAVGAIMGAVIGGVVGILVAPRSGKETREDIGNTASKLLDKAASAKDEVLFKADDTLGGARDKASTLTDKIKSKLHK